VFNGLFHRRYDGFLTDAECDHIIEIAGEKVERSQVVGANGESKVDSARTSNGIFLSNWANDPIVQRMERRIATLTQIPRDHGETMYLLRYLPNQEYKGHFDYFDDKVASHLGNSGNRIVTTLMYLSDVEEGGSTSFPNADNGPVKVKPKKGTAVVFFDYTPDLNPDPQSLHASEPVVRGTKWSLTRWIRARHF
jgi:prolyl 4-hydroxylase